MQNVLKDLTWIRERVIKNGAMKNLTAYPGSVGELVVEGGNNKMLHTREKHVESDDVAKKRPLFRARFYDRVNLH
jgi:hypothetical protein